MVMKTKEYGNALDLVKVCCSEKLRFYQLIRLIAPKNILTNQVRILNLEKSIPKLPFIGSKS